MALDFESSTMDSVDLAFILKQITGCYFFISSAFLKIDIDAVRQMTKYDFDENIFLKAAGLMTASALDMLGKLSIRKELA